MSEPTETTGPAPGQRAYETYFAAMKGANTKGEQLPAFSELLATIQEAWAAVEAELRGLL